MAAEAASPELDYLASYLVGAHLRPEGLGSVPWVARLDGEKAEQLQSAVVAAASALAVPAEVVLRNPGVNPARMDSLLAYFEHFDRDAKELVPVVPESDDAVETYVHILGRINKHLTRAFGPPGRVFQCALLVTNWMRGQPLARLISNRVAYLQRKKQQHELQSVIRSVMADVEVQRILESRPRRKE